MHKNRKYYENGLLAEYRTSTALSIIPIPLSCNGMSASFHTLQLVTVRLPKQPANTPHSLLAALQTHPRRALTTRHRSALNLMSQHSNESFTTTLPETSFSPPLRFLWSLINLSHKISGQSGASSLHRTLTIFAIPTQSPNSRALLPRLSSIHTLMR